MAMPDWIKKELETNLRAAAVAGRRAARSEPRAATATYVPRTRSLAIELTNGVEFSIPVKLVPSLKGAPARALSGVEVLGLGGGLHWAALDLDLSVPALVASIFEGSTWMAELGRAGGRRSTAAKASAARKNGQKGGRPRTRSTLRV
jgi:Protein of unknown function (DUF2442)